MKTKKPTKQKKPQRKIECDDCGKVFNSKDLRYGPDPFDSEVYDDHTPKYLCNTCYNTSLEET